MADDLITDLFQEKQREVEQALEELVSAVNSKDLDRLEALHLYGPKFTKFDDFEPLERVDADTCRAGERAGLSVIERIHYALEDLKVDVFDRTAIATFLLHEDMRIGGKDITAIARSTLVWIDDGERWRITHEHFSPFKANP
jgi:ketosteroid isomerase-like protein